MLRLSHCYLMYVGLQKNGLQVSLWLNLQILDSRDNVLVVHCNAGKGRTGSAICAILLYMKVFNDIESCLKLFGYQRFSCTKGVTQPCQLRYLYYFEAFFKRKVLSPCLKRLKGIQFVKVPNISGGGAVPIFDVYQCNNSQLTKLYSHTTQKFYDSELDEGIIFELSDEDKESFILQGDIKIVFKNNDMYHTTICRIMFNTSFIQRGNYIQAGKMELSP